jgi:hypothetical protein
MFGRKWRKLSPNSGRTMHQAVEHYQPRTCACSPGCPGHVVTVAAGWPSDFKPTAEEYADNELLRAAWMRYLADPNSSRTVKADHITTA